MLGTIGFLAGGAAIIAFVWSASRAYTSVDPLRLRAFLVAFGLLAVAMFVWAVIVVANDPGVTRNFMLASDVLLLLGTVAMIVVVTGLISPLFAVLLGTAVALMTGYRAYVQPPTAFVRDGLLYFNLQGSSRYLIVGLFALIWLPIAMYFASKLASDRLLKNHVLTLQAYFVILVAEMGMFAKTQRSAAIIFLFVAIVVTFLIMTVFNLALIQAHAVAPKGEPRHAAKRK